MKTNTKEVPNMFLDSNRVAMLSQVHAWLEKTGLNARWEVHAESMDIRGELYTLRKPPEAVFSVSEGLHPVVVCIRQDSQWTWFLESPQVEGSWKGCTFVEALNAFIESVAFPGTVSPEALDPAGYTEVFGGWLESCTYPTGVWA